MFKLTNVFRLCLPTRVFLSPSKDTDTEAASFNSLEVGIRALTQRDGHPDPVRLKTLLDDLIECGDPRKGTLCKEACRLAYAAGYYACCAELFFSCRALAPVSLSDVVVSAAALTLKPEYLQNCLSALETAGGVKTPLSHEALLLLCVYWKSTWCYVRIERARQTGKNRKSDMIIDDEIEATTEMKTAENEAKLKQYMAISARAFYLLQLPSNVSFDNWWAKSKRLVLYNARDKGEAAVYEQHFSFWERHFGGELREWMTPSFLVGMMRSCVKAERWDFAGRYAELAESYLLSGVNPPDDTLLQQCVFSLNMLAQNARGAQLIKNVCDLYPDYIPSVAVVHSAARVAGSIADERLGIWCLQALLSERQPIPPSSQDIFLSLVALAKCRALNFKKLFCALENSGLIKPNEEERLHLDLLFSRHSVYWEEEVGQKIEGYFLSATGDFSRAAMSARNISLLLRILQESEHAKFMDYYTLFRNEFSGRENLPVRAQWAAIALKWAMFQRSLSEETCDLLVSEARTFLDDTADGSSAVPLDHSLKSKLRSRLGVLEQLWRKERDNETTTTHSGGDILLARFVRQRHCLPRVCSQMVEGDVSRPRKELWRLSSALASFSQRQWKESVFKG